MTDETTPSIEVQPDGPYLVHGRVPLRRTRQVETDDGVPMSWQTTAELETDDTVALCRCGQSSNKPFCDGTHDRQGFDGAESAPTDSYDERADRYPVAGLEMRDDRSICEHAGFCGNGRTNVWKMADGPARESDAVRAEMLRMVVHCPSGALTASTDDGRAIEPPLATAIGVVADGPLAVTGSIPVERADGQPLETRPRMTLCRCGQSSIKPLCDGSHADAGFTDSA